MTLKDYFESLPEDTNPRADFVKQLTKLCDVTDVAARNWCRGDFYPSSEKKHEIIMGLTGGVPIKEYYQSLPEKTSVRNELIKRLVSVTRKSETEVRWWLQGKHTPKNKTTKMLISIVTGIPTKDL